MASSKPCDHVLELLTEGIHLIIPPDDNAVAPAPDLTYVRVPLLSGTSNLLLARPSSTSLSSSDSSCKDIFVDILRQSANDGDAYLLAFQRLSTDSGKFVFGVHLVGLSSQSTLECVFDFEVEDELGEHMLVVWKVQRCLFRSRDCERRSGPLHPIAFAYVDSHVSLSSILHNFGLDYLFTVFGFSFPHPSWLSFWPWGRFSFIFKPSIDLATLFTNSPNKRELTTFTNVFWGYFVPFLVDRFSRLSQPILDSFKALQSELEKSNQAARVFLPLPSDQPISCFLTGLTDLSAFRDPNVLDLLHSYLLPFATSEDLDALIRRSSDVCVLLLQETALCELFADYRPDLIVQLLENRYIRQESLRCLLLYAEHEGDVVLTDWIRFILNLLLDCLLQCEDNYQDGTVLAKVKAPFAAAPSPLRGLVDLELQRFGLAYGGLHGSLQSLSRLATRRALRFRLNTLTCPPYVALTEYIAQLQIPSHFRSFLSTYGLLGLPVGSTSSD
ncbi:hypothetical protein SprV_0100146200 [Sparganum proliferum]